MSSPLPLPRVLTAFGAAVAVTLVAGLSLAGPARTEAPKADAGKPVDPRAEIARRLEVGIDAVRPSLLPGIYEVAHGAEVLYVSGDGRYALSGDLYDTDTGNNLTTQRRTEARYAALKAVSDDDAIIFAPKNPRYSVTVFTDVDCAFCRRLHSEIAEYNRLGVRVRYLFYPRGGPGSDSWKKAEAVWCAPNRQEALTRAKTGAAIASHACGTTPVARTYELGQELGIRGTPGIFTDRGVYLPGYLPPDRLLERLKQLESGAPADSG
jgi:thiol:disulfide interchange protein DsbC